MIIHIDLCGLYLQLGAMIKVLIISMFCRALESGKIQELVNILYLL